MKVTCETCGTRFASNLTEAPLEDGGIRLSFSCPNCATVYPVLRMTAEGVRIRAQLQVTTDRIAHLRLRKRLEREVVDERE